MAASYLLATGEPPDGYCGCRGSLLACRAPRPAGALLRPHRSRRRDGADKPPPTTSQGKEMTQPNAPGRPGGRSDESSAPRRRRDHRAGQRVSRAACPATRSIVLPLEPAERRAEGQDEQGPGRRRARADVEAARLQRPRRAGAGRRRAGRSRSASRTCSAVSRSTGRRTRRPQPRPALRAGADEVRPLRQGREGAGARSSRWAAPARTGSASASRSSSRRSGTRPRARSRARRTCCRTTRSPSLHLAKVVQGQERTGKAEREMIERAIHIDAELRRRLGLPLSAGEGGARTKRPPSPRSTSSPTPRRTRRPRRRSSRSRASTRPRTRRATRRSSSRRRPSSATTTTRSR